MQAPWVERYRPKNLEEVALDSLNRHILKKAINLNKMPNMIFYGPPGTGKTTLAKVLLTELDVDSMDILEINASNENNVDTIRNKITNFSSTMPFGDLKYVLLDEADYITPNGQAALRGVMEMYHTSCRFILTCNYPQRIIPALHSRCQGFHIAKVDMTEFTARVAEILITEGVTPDLDTLDTYVKASYPDLRKCINTVQMNSQDGKLLKPNESDKNEADWKLEMVELFKAGKISEARKLVCASARAEEMEEVYRWLYDNIELFGTEEQQDKAVIIIKQGLVDHTLVVDPEINLAATLIKLGRLAA